MEVILLYFSDFPVYEGKYPEEEPQIGCNKSHVANPV